MVNGRSIDRITPCHTPPRRTPAHHLNDLETAVFFRIAATCEACCRPIPQNRSLGETPPFRACFVTGQGMHEGLIEEETRDEPVFQPVRLRIPQ